MKIPARWLLPLMLVVIELIIIVVGRASASQNGRIGFSGNPNTNSGQTCTTCHSMGAAIPTIALQGPTAVVAGTTHLYTVKLAGGPAQVAGFNVSTSNNRGQFVPTGSDTQLIQSELTHSVPKLFDGNEATFTFSWTAPTFDDTVTIYVAGNSANGNGDLSGDGVANTSLTIEVTGGSGGPPANTPTPSTTLELSLVVDGLTQPVDIQNAGDARLFVVEKAGRIRLIKNGSLLATAFLDITSRVTAGGGNAETGMLGLAFHPDYQSNGHFYLNYTVSDPLRTRIARFSVDADNPDVADPNSELVIMEFAQPFSNHNGGQLQFGPDGHLYIAAGDGGSQGDPNNYAQSNSVLLGKILRIDVTGTTGGAAECSTAAPSSYRIPASNPLVDGAGGACDEIWASGLRNPWRFSFDRITGDLWIADVGQSSREEINFATANSNGGENYGWRCYEGSQSYHTSGCGPVSSYTAPIYDFNRNQGDCSITGGYVYRGLAYPNLNGHYFFSDFCNRTIRSISGAPANVTFTSWQHPSAGFNPATFGQDLNGELYVGYLSGELYRIVGAGAVNTPTPTNTPTNTPPSTSTSTPTPTDTPMPPNTPTSTSTPTATDTPQPTPTLSPVSCIPGDVTCDEEVNADDALAILEFDVGVRTASTTLPLPANAIFQPACDVSGDGRCSSIDAFLILQCDSGLHNVFCPEE